MSQMETLIDTLLANGLAASRSEAQRMANDMMSTSNKVNESMRNTGYNYMVKNFKDKRHCERSEAISSSGTTI